MTIKVLDDPVGPRIGCAYRDGSPMSFPPVDQIFAYVDEGNGVVAVEMDGWRCPAVSVRESGAKRMEPAIRRMASETGRTIRLLRFTGPMVVETFSPRGSDN